MFCQHFIIRNCSKFLLVAFQLNPQNNINFKSETISLLKFILIYGHVQHGENNVIILRCKCYYMITLNVTQNF